MAAAASKVKALKNAMQQRCFRVRHSVDFAFGFHGLPGPSAVENQPKLIGLRLINIDDDFAEIPQENGSARSSRSSASKKRGQNLLLSAEAVANHGR